jgi:uncharacterized membrane protein
MLKTTTAIISTSSRESTSKGSPWKTQVSFHISCYRKDLYQSLEITTIHNYQEFPGLLLERLWIRFGMASAGGLVLIGPMLIMANLQTKTASLVTTCIAMVLFAAGITFGTQLKPDQVLGATAAYAAVLVVFVGTSFST